MENQETQGESIVQFKNGAESSEAPKIKKVEKTEPKSFSGRLYMISRTLRLIVEVLLILTIYIIAKKIVALNEVAGILLIALFSIYLLILGADIFIQINRRSVSDVPMFLFAVLGFLLFAAAAEGVYLLRNGKSYDALHQAIIILCIIEALLLLLDVTLLILNWRQAHMKIAHKCPFGRQLSNVTTIYQPEDDYSRRTIRVSDSLIFRQKDVHDVTTSISDYQRPSHSDLANLHKYRKVGIGHQREYMDRPVSALPVVPLRVVDVQTDPPPKKAVSNVESLVVAEVKEEPAQTMPKCPVCANNWNPNSPFFRRPDNFGLCPTFLHLAQGFGMCNCSHQSSSILRPIPVEFHTESTSAIDLEVSRRIEKPNSRKNSNQEQ